MDWQQHIQETVQHLCSLASIPGFKAHAWFQANDMARREPDLYGDIPTLLTQAMHKGQTNESSL